MYYRVEDKYIISEDRIAYLKALLSEVMDKDIHSDSKNGSYTVRSLYFDDLNDSCMRENEAGVNARSKFRIRMYDNDEGFIMLEEKSSLNGRKKKESVRIDKDRALEYMAMASSYRSLNLQGPGYYTGAIDPDSPFLIKKLFTDINTVRMSPKVIVEYERTAYVERNGNVRITFDKNIGAGYDISRFWDKDIAFVPITDKGCHILEVKYDEILPGYIKKIIDSVPLTRLSYSKYYTARKMQNERAYIG